MPASFYMSYCSYYKFIFTKAERELANSKDSTANRLHNCGYAMSLCLIDVSFIIQTVCPLPLLSLSSKEKQTSESFCVLYASATGGMLP